MYIEMDGRHDSLLIIAKYAAIGAALIGGPHVQVLLCINLRSGRINE